MLALLSDPVKRGLVEELLIASDASPGHLASRMQLRFGIGRPAISGHITQLEAGLVLARSADGRAIRLVDPHGMQVLILDAHRLASTAIGSAALVTAAVRADLEDKLQASQASRPDFSAFFAYRSEEPTFDTDGVIQRPGATRVPQAHALSREGWKLDIVWVATDVTGPGVGSLRHSVPARYYPPRAHLLAINADWPPLVRAVERHASGMTPAEAWEAACGLMEREAVHAL
ncbi:MAG: hypothetical protein WKF96_14355, partial [Solirubrobacteraceae bacterium]